MVKDTFFGKNRLINGGGKYIDLSVPRIMGILNITPDSFFDGGRYVEEGSVKKRVAQMLEEGADLIDIGAYSSRPGATEISEKEELDRLQKALSWVREEHPDAILSVDTFRSGVARKVVEEFGVAIINDISGGMLDTEMIDTIADLNVVYILMHMPGNPKSMQKNTNYTDMIREIIEFLARQTENLRSKGIVDIIADPGFGFGKTLDQNYQLLGNLSAFKILQLPLLAGISRKSMIYRFLQTTPEETLTGTCVLNTIALQNGADILRVHDVKEAKQTIELVMKTKTEENRYLEQISL